MSAMASESEPTLLGGPDPARLDPQTLDLLGRARAGDAPAYDELFARAIERVLVFVRARLGPRLAGKLEPMDLLQETYAEAHKAFASFEYRGDGSFVRWLCRIAENQIRGQANHFGAAKRRSPGGVLPVTRVLERARTTATGPGTALGRVEDRDRLVEALAKLTEEERQAILLRFFQDRTIDEIATALETSASSARRILGRAVERLGAMVAPPETRPAER